jgi:hypothetical protein
MGRARLAREIRMAGGIAAMLKIPTCLQPAKFLEQPT